MRNNQPNTIEVKDDVTDRQIELLQKMNPNSLILRESDDRLYEIYKWYRKSIWNKIF